MKIYRLPEKIRALAFDMDLTLYSNAEYALFQIDSLIMRMAERQGLLFEEMKSKVEEERKMWALSHGGKKPSLTNVMARFGISMEENIGWRESSYDPKKYIKEDKRLRHTLELLSREFVLGVVTNNPVLTARKTFEALGVGKCFTILVGLDTCCVTKPDKIPFMKFSELSGCPPETCVSVGDRYDIDIDLPLEMGMGGILVDGVEDVYELPGILLNNC